ncbi:MAG TPA: GDSL-type esterase/lipase family protein [Patescibacteria group bacterium]|nr:GDSL-type esterase/lipase family protein [Patescibacteria group bacterium]
MDRRLVRAARLLGAFIGTFAGVVAVQFMRLRRMEFLPMHPGFYVNHVVAPGGRSGEGGRLRLVVLGDSTTAGVGVGRAEDALPYRLAQHIADRERRPVHVVSYGWAGARVADLPATQLPRALEPLREGETAPFLPGADIVALVIGSNDATHHTRPGRYRADLRRALEIVRESAPQARVVLAGIPAFRGALKAIEPLISLADTYARLLRRISRAEAARARVAYADLARHVPPRIDRTTEFLSSDQFHPSAVGYAIWADVIFEALLEGPAPQSPPPTAAPMEPAGA